MTQVMLDRQQREALRHEFEVEASGYGDFEIALRNGERGYVERHLEKLRRIFEAMDAIGWTEQAGTPDAQPVSANDGLSAFAQAQATELGEAFREDFVPDDRDLDAYRALSAMGDA